MLLLHGKVLFLQVKGVSKAPELALSLVMLTQSPCAAREEVAEVCMFLGSN